MLHFKPFSPLFHAGVNLFQTLFLFLAASLVVVSHLSVDSPIDIHLSQEKRVVGISGLIGFFYEPIISPPVVCSTNVPRVLPLAL